MNKKKNGESDILLGMRFNFGANISERETQGLQGMTRRRRDSPERKWLMNKRRETVARFSQRASYSTADSAQQFSVETVPYNPFACSFFHLSLYILCQQYVGGPFTCERLGYILLCNFYSNRNSFKFHGQLEHLREIS